MLLTAAVAMIMMAPQGAAPQHSSSKKLAPENIYAFKMKDIDGKVVKRFGSRVAPGSEELVAAVEQTLAN